MYRNSKISINTKNDIVVYVTEWDSCDRFIEDSESEVSDISSDLVRKDPTYDPTSVFFIQGYAITADGHSMTVNISGFQPYFFIKIPEYWSTNHVRIFLKYVEKNLVRRQYVSCLVSHRMLRVKPFSHFTGYDKFQYLELVFRNSCGFFAWSNVFQKEIIIPALNDGEPFLYQLFESNIKPVLRFLHVRDVKGVGWILLRGGTYYSEIEFSSSSQIEVTVEYKKVYPYLDNTETNYLYQGNRINPDSIPKIIYAAYDIEADSSHGDFPIAKKDYTKLAQDIINHYPVRRKKGVGHNQIVRHIYRWIKLAFHPLYGSNIIQKVSVANNSFDDTNSKSDATFSKTLDYVAYLTYRVVSKSFLKVTSKKGEDGEDDSEHDGEYEDDADIDYIYVLMKIFHRFLPELEPDTNNDYYRLADQIISECQRLYSRKNVDFFNNPLGVIKLLLELGFDPYYDNPGINRIYTKWSRSPSDAVCQNVAPYIASQCEDVYSIVQNPPSVGRKEYIRKLKEVRHRAMQNIVENLNSAFYHEGVYVEGDHVIQIGTTFKRYGETDCFLKHIICLGSCAPITNQTLIDDEHKDIYIPIKDLALELKPKSGDSEELIAKKKELSKSLSLITAENPESDPNYLTANQFVTEHRHQQQNKTDTAEVIVESYETEAEVLLAWTRLISETDPDVVIGYNIFGFDFKFMHERAEEISQDLAVEKWSHDATEQQRREFLDKFTLLGRDLKPQQLVSSELKSSGLGQNELHYIKMTGRVLVDLYKVTQKDQRLESYKLDFVCKKFLFKSKNDLPPSEIFIKQRGDESDRRIIAVYCLIDCILCNRYIDKMEILTNNISMAQVCSVPFSYLFLRGQGIKLLSLVSKFCRRYGYILPTLEKVESSEGYQGAIVLDAESDIYLDDPIVVGDFNSLYPSCMISENLSHDSYVVPGTKYYELLEKGELVDKDGNPWTFLDKSYEIYQNVPVAGTKKIRKVQTGVKVCRFAQPPKDEKSIIPKILMGLLQARKDTRKRQRQFPEKSFEWNVLEGQQLAFKVTANSLYGQIGARTSAIYLKDIAACTTSTGRTLIYFSRDFIHANYPKSHVVYGDTDSIFSKFHCTDLHGNKLVGLDAVYRSYMLCMEATIAISRQLRQPHNIEIEKVIWPFILVTKKRYHGHYYTKFATNSYYANSMGLVLKRRDNAKIVKYIVGGMVDIIMKERSIENAKKFVMDACRSLLKGEFPINMFILTRTLRGFYKNPDQIAHNVLAQRIAERDPGSKPQSNDRMPFVYIVNENPEALQGDRIETPEFAQNNLLKTDYRIYLTNQIWKPMIQILSLKKGTDINGKELLKELLDSFNSSGTRDLFDMLNLKIYDADADAESESDSEYDSDNDSDDVDEFI